MIPVATHVEYPANGLVHAIYPRYPEEHSSYHTTHCGYFLTSDLGLCPADPAIEVYDASARVTCVRCLCRG